MQIELGNIDYGLLQKQAEIIGRIIDGKEITVEERDKLNGVWELLHEMMDWMLTHAKF